MDANQEYMLLQAQRQAAAKLGQPAPATAIGRPMGMPEHGIFGDAMRWLGKKNAPQIGENPYQNNWGSLIGQLEQQSAGTGPSLAGDAYKQAQQTGMQNVLAMSRGGSAGATRAGQQTLGRMNQGLSQGYANARLQEQLAARQALQQALMGAGNAWFQPQAANLQAQMGTQSNGQKLLNFVGQVAQGAGALGIGRGGGGSGSVGTQYMGNQAPGSYGY